MKKIFALGITVFSAAIVMAQPPNVPADKGSTFGTEVNVDNAMPVPQMVKSLKSQASDKPMSVKISGEVLQVCEAEGCWLKMKNGDETVMVKMRDHKFLVPTALKGKTIVVQGDAEIKETSVSQLKHYAEDAGQPKAEIDKIKAPKREVLVKADGIVVL